MIQKLNAKRGEEGFTLVEMMVVIVILGILAAIVVFAVTGLGTKAGSNACATDAQIISSAEEANYVQFGSYDTVGNLVAHGFLHKPSNLYTAAAPAAVPPALPNYTLTGIAGAAANGTTCVTV